MSDAVDLRTVVMDLTKQNIQLRDERDQLERQLAAAERMFEVLRYQDASFNMNNGDRLNLLEAISDYANAKEPK